MINKIIVHAGTAHLGDLVACAEALVGWAWDDQSKGVARIAAETVIERRPATASESDDGDALILRRGPSGDTDFSSLDYHQLPPGTGESDMVLLAQTIPVPENVRAKPSDTLYDAMARLYPWYKARAAVDAVGPFAAAKEKGLEWPNVASFLGPCEDIVLRQFQAASPATRAQVVLPLARDIITKIDCERTVLEATKRWTTAQGVDVIDFTGANPLELSEVAEAIIAPAPGGVVIFRDKRGAGYALLRIKDDPRVDLAKAREMPCMALFHASGSYATTREPVSRKTLADILATAFVPQPQA